MSYGLVYKITNNTSGKVYIGQTIRSLNVRWKQHIYDALSEKRSIFPIHEAIRKYGKETFSIEIICECFSQKELDEQEKYFCDMFSAWSPNGYNLRAGQGRGTFSIESRRKMSESAKGRVRSETAKIKTSRSLKGHSTSQETRDKIGSKNAKKTFYFLSPTLESVEVRNLQKFARENGLQAAHLHCVHTLKSKAHKGWTRDHSKYKESVYGGIPFF